MLNFEEMFTGESHAEPEITASSVDYNTLNDAESLGEFGAQIDAMATFEAIKTDKEIMIAAAVGAYAGKELSGESREMLTDLMAKFGSLYGITGEGIGDVAKNVVKTLEIYARKFIAFVGKWIAKAGTVFGSLESTRKECLAAVEGASKSTEIEVTQEWVNKVTAFFGANKKGKASQGNAILTFNQDLINFDHETLKLKTNKDMHGKLPMKSVLGSLANNFYGVDKISKFLGDKDGDALVVTGTRGALYIIVNIYEDGDEKKPVKSKFFTLLFKYKEKAFKVGKVTLDDLNIALPALKDVLEVDAKARRKLIDVEYGILKDVLKTDILKEIADEAKYKAAAKQVMINSSKVYFKSMFNVNKAYKDAIRIGKMIKVGKADDKSEDKE